MTEDLPLESIPDKQKESDRAGPQTPLDGVRDGTSEQPVVADVLG